VCGKGKQVHYPIVNKKTKKFGNQKIRRGVLMKIGIVISTNDPEEVWNAFRFGNTALKANHSVKVFLVNKGVEAENIVSSKFDVKGQMDSFLENKGKLLAKGELLACRTCMNVRLKESSKYYEISSLKDLLKIVEESGKVIAFG
jgi:uncharacterized protein involved in oxidation of intracellular sulfur